MGIGKGWPGSSGPGCSDQAEGFKRRCKGLAHAQYLQVIRVIVWEMEYVPESSPTKP